MNGVQWIERDEIDAQRRDGPVDQIAQIAEIAAAPVAIRAQAIERHAEARVFAWF